MLHTISWQQYGAALFLITAVWYGYVLLKFRKPVLKSPVQPMPPVAMTPVIGGIRPDEGDAVNPEELLFSLATPDDISDATVPKGPTDDFLLEAQTLADAADTKCEFLSLLEILVMKYEPDHLDFASLYEQLVLPYNVSLEEWPLTQKLSA